MRIGETPPPQPSFEFGRDARRALLDNLNQFLELTPTDAGYGQALQRLQENLEGLQYQEGPDRGIFVQMAGHLQDLAQLHARHIELLTQVKDTHAEALGSRGGTSSEVLVTSLHRQIAEHQAQISVNNQLLHDPTLSSLELQAIEVDNYHHAGAIQDIEDQLSRLNPAIFPPEVEYLVASDKLADNNAAILETRSNLIQAADELKKKS